MQKECRSVPECGSECGGRSTRCSVEFRRQGGVAECRSGSVARNVGVQ